MVKKNASKNKVGLVQIGLEALRLRRIYESVIHCSDTAFAIFEPDSLDLIYITVSRAYLALYGLDKRGFTVESIRGKSHYEVFEGLIEARPDFKEQNDRVITHLEAKRSTKIEFYNGAYFHWRIYPSMRSGEIIAVVFEIEPREING